MVKATFKDQMSNALTLRYTKSGAVVSAEVIVANGVVLVAVNKAEANEENVYICGGRMEFPKEVDLAVNAGDQVYFDAGNECITTTAGENTPCGFCIKPALAADTEITIMLWPNIIAATVTNIQLADGKVLFGAANGIAAAKTISGDITFTREGVGTLKLTKSLENSIADPGDGEALPVDKSGSIAITTAAAETNTLAAPSVDGLLLSLTCDVHAVGDRVVTCATTVNQTGNNTLTFGAAGDTILLYSVQIGGALRWRVAANDGVALSTV